MCFGIHAHASFLEMCVGAIGRLICLRKKSQIKKYVHKYRQNHWLEAESPSAKPPYGTASQCSPAARACGELPYRLTTVS